MAVPVLAHRLVLLPELEIDRGARSGVVEEALARVAYRRSPKAG
jgi:MoxR-like ATPase